MTNEKTVDDLNGFELIELKKRVGGKLETADGVDTAYALTYIFKKRDVEGFTYDDALGMKFRDVQDYLGLEDDELPSEDPFADDESPKD